MNLKRNSSSNCWIWEDF